MSLAHLHPHLTHQNTGPCVARAHLAILLLGMFFATFLLAAETDDQQEKQWQNMLKPASIPGTTSHTTVPYLPADRLVGDPHPLRDHQLTLDIHIPTASSGPRPCVVYVHGGSFSAGDKKFFGPQLDLAKALLAKGFVVASVNYVLSPRGVMPQMLWDVRDAIRFLRKESTRYHIDPDRIGAIGISAGGWLLSAMEFPRSDWVTKRWMSTISIADHDSLLQRARNVKEMVLSYAGGTTRLWFPMTNPQPSYPEFAGCLTAVSMDFHQHSQDLPAVDELAFWNAITGSGKDGSVRSGAPQGYASLTLDFSLSSIAEKKYWGKGVHAPSWQAETWLADGKAKGTLTDRMVEFFTDALITRARTPEPEFRCPSWRSETPVAIGLAASSSAVAIHFTTDGSTPTAQSPRYQNPVSVAPGTTIKAIGFAPGTRPSVVITGEVIRGPVPPQITSPSTVALPEAEVGKFYEVRFSADRSGVFWETSGDFRWRPRAGDGRLDPRKKLDQRKQDDPDPEMLRWNGLVIDPQTGVFAGTPRFPGRFWLQVQVGDRKGDLGSLRNYRLVVTGTGKEVVPTDTIQAEDTNTLLCHLPQAKPKAVAELIRLLVKQGLNPVSEGADEGFMILVPADQIASAGKLLAEAAGQAKVGTVILAEE